MLYYYKISWSETGRGDDESLWELLEDAELSEHDLLWHALHVCSDCKHTTQQEKVFAFVEKWTPVLNLETAAFKHKFAKLSELKAAKHFWSCTKVDLYADTDGMCDHFVLSEKRYDKLRARDNLFSLPPSPEPTPKPSRDASPVRQ